MGLRRREIAGPVSLDGQLLESGVEFGELIHDARVADALLSLSVRRRLIVFLHYFGDLSYEQIAELCDVSPGTVAATLAQARDAVRAALTENDEVTT